MYAIKEVAFVLAAWFQVNGLRPKLDILDVQANQAPKRSECCKDFKTGKYTLLATKSMSSCYLAAQTWYISFQGSHQGHN